MPQGGDGARGISRQGVGGGQGVGDAAVGRAEGLRLAGVVQKGWKVAGLVGANGRPVVGPGLGDWVALGLEQGGQGGGQQQDTEHGHGGGV